MQLKLSAMTFDPFSLCKTAPPMVGPVSLVLATQPGVEGVAHMAVDPRLDPYAGPPEESYSESYVEEAKEESTFWYYFVGGLSAVAAVGALHYLANAESDPYEEPKPKKEKALPRRPPTPAPNTESIGDGGYRTQGSSSGRVARSYR